MALLKRIENIVMKLGDGSTWLPPNASKPLEEAASLRLEIHSEGNHFMLHTFSDHPKVLPSGCSWHETLDEALKQAEFSYGVKPSQWSDVRII